VSWRRSASRYTFVFPAMAGERAVLTNGGVDYADDAAFRVALEILLALVVCHFGGFGGVGRHFVYADGLLVL
jgi:hypothetical protein